MEAHDMYARISASRAPEHAIVAYAGGARVHTIFSCSVHAMLPMFDTRAVLPLRSVCKDMRTAIALQPFADATTRIRSDGVAAWRACFPAACVSNLCSAGAEELAAARAALPGVRIIGQLTSVCVARLWHGSDATGLAVLDSGLLVSGGYENSSLRLWNATTGEAVGTIEGSWGGGIAALPGGHFAIVGWSDDSASVWSAATRARAWELSESTGIVKCAVALSNGLVATGSSDTTVRLWTAATGASVATLQGHTDFVLALAMLPDGRLASCGDNTVRLWDLSTLSCVAVLQDRHYVLALAALDDGRLASGCSSGEVHLWNAMHEIRDATLEGHTDWVRALAVLPRGLLASGSDDWTVRIWSVAARACVAVLQEHTASVFALAALPGGRLASGSRGDDGVICVWELH